MSKIHSFHDLQVWHKVRALTVTVYKITESFPKHEIFGLTSQMRRASVSIVANIAEGSGRRTSGTLAHHLDIAHGSTMELLALTYVAEDVGYLLSDHALGVRQQIYEVSKMLNALHASIRKNSDK
jgi:four helix bundle protein